MKLKKCPFCGSIHSHILDNRKSIYIECSDCGTRSHEINYCNEPEERKKGQMSAVQAEKEVIRKWNRRVSWLESLRLLMTGAK